MQNWPTTASGIASAGGVFLQGLLLLLVNDEDDFCYMHSRGLGLKSVEL